MIFIFDETKEPEDIFAEKPSGKQGAAVPPSNLPVSGASPASAQKPTTPDPVGESGVIVEKSAFGKKLVFGGVIVGILLIGFGVWYLVIYNRGASIQVNQQDFTQVTPSPAPSGTTTPAVSEDAVPSEEGTVPTTGESSAPPADDLSGTAPEGVTPSAPPDAETGTIQDADRDGLTDSEEAALGTDPADPDTDDDGLNDREEVRTYGTDPLNPDTDGDGFDDGSEVRNGYDPNGPGRLLQIPQ